MIVLAAGDLAATQAAGAVALDALGTGAHGAAHGILHGAAVRNTLLQLSGDVLSHKLGVHIGVADLNDVQLHGLADELLNALAILLDLRAALADDHAGTGHMQVNGDNLAAALDLDLGDTGCIQELLQVHADLVILYQEVAYLLIAGIPTGIPVYEDGYVLLDFKLEKPCPLEEVMNLFEDQMELVILYHKVTSVLKAV